MWCKPVQETGDAELAKDDTDAARNRGGLSKDLFKNQQQ